MNDTYYIQQFTCIHCEQNMKVAMKYNDTAFLCPYCYKECHVKSVKEKRTYRFKEEPNHVTSIRLL